jgi:hypothetical protein
LRSTSSGTGRGRPGGSTTSNAGKGDRPRRVDKKKYDENYERIFRKKAPPFPPRFSTKGVRIVDVDFSPVKVEQIPVAPFTPCEYE